MNHSANSSGANYILAALLPRLEHIKPGLTQDLLAGIRADKAAIESAGKMTPDIEETFCVAEHILAAANP
ncbi:hypothetical protein GG681_00740 [Epibacterium sp. SM1969]|uniref:Uncharacterized protein n=1 Tax=Tritonibacter aquimaris TaxID=2663379 RepID=A0A844AP70_9RHOB|nr:hypothetical protein [Tritonibacter aquimaris]MQY41157.1 hypothetical protein [Tritonibacter aquimaris]